MSDSGPSIQYKFGQSGLDSMISRIKELHEQFRTGQITYKEYSKAARETTEQGKAVSQQFNQMKEAISAANPELLQYTRTMSTFGGVANTVLSVTNAINLAQMATMQQSSQLTQIQTSLAAVRNQEVRDMNAYGPASAQVQADKQQEIALLNQESLAQRNLAFQTVSSSATLVASSVAIAGSMSQTIMMFKTFYSELNPAKLEAFATTLASVGTAALTILGPIAVVTAAIYGLYYAYRALDPAFAQESDQIYNAILKNWHLDTLSATLLAPWVTFLVDLEGTGDAFENIFIGMYNGILQYFINPSIRAWDATIGHFTGSIGQISPAGMVHQTLDQAMQEIGLGTASSASSTTGSSMSAANQMMLTGTLPGAAGSSTLQQTSQQQLSQAIMSGGTLSGILQQQQQAGSRLTSANSNLVTIHTSLASLDSSTTSGFAALQSATNATTTAINTMSTAMTSAQKAQQDAINAGLQSLQQKMDQNNQTLQSLQQQAKQLSALPQTEQYQYQDLVVNPFENDTEYQVTRTGTRATAAAQQLQQVNQQIAQLQGQQASLTSQAQQVVANAATSGILDVSTSGVQSTIASLGLSSDTGIGSIIAGALGNGSGSGAYAGINSQQLAQFAATGDYGVFSNAVLQDNKTLAQQTDPNNQYTQLVQSYRNMGFSASQAASYANAVKENSNNFNGSRPSPNNNGGYGAGSAGASEAANWSAWGAASGFEGVLTTPTHFVAGEAGPEAVSIQPLSKGGSSERPINITVIAQGNIHTESEVKQFILDTIKEDLRGVGF
ncbi:MAG: hypothetical protein KGI33_01225 [Thaumarchaeota archaeon]|nr:hypothetical protein [Nitrososphaerota archaeon]